MILFDGNIIIYLFVAYTIDYLKFLENKDLKIIVSRYLLSKSKNFSFELFDKFDKVCL